MQKSLAVGAVYHAKLVNDNLFNVFFRHFCRYIFHFRGFWGGAGVPFWGRTRTG